MTITRREIFAQAWKSARRMRDCFPTIRAAFADALRRVWAMVKEMALAEPSVQARPMAHRVASVVAADRRRRFGAECMPHCW